MLRDGTIGLRLGVLASLLLLLDMFLERWHLVWLRGVCNIWRSVLSHDGANLIFLPLLTFVDRLGIKSLLVSQLNMICVEHFLHVRFVHEHLLHVLHFESYI